MVCSKVIPVWWIMSETRDFFHSAGEKKKKKDSSLIAGNNGFFKGYPLQIAANGCYTGTRPLSALVDC